MKKILFVLSLFLIGLSVPNLTYAQQAEEDVQKLLLERDAEIKELMGPEGTEYNDAQRNELKEIINGIIDFGAMARAALVNTYDTISEDLRTEFVDLFSIIIRYQSLNILDIYRAEVTYNSIEIDGNQVRIETTAQLNNVRTPVNYDMQFSNNEWSIIDMEIDDVSTVD